MLQEYLFGASGSCLVIAAVLATIALLKHKRKRALWMMTGGVYLALVLLFVLKSWHTEGQPDLYAIMIAADYSLDVFSLGYRFDHLPEFTAQALGTDYRAYAAFLFVLAPVLTLSNVLAFFQTTIDGLRYLVVPGTKYILSELNGESLALAESIRKKEAYAQIVFTGVGNPEKKYDTKLLEKARELSALCLKRDISCLHLGLPLRKNLIFLISHHEPENVSDALALIEKYRDTQAKIDIYVYASSRESKLAIDAANKGSRCLHAQFRTHLKNHLQEIIRNKNEKSWKSFVRMLEEVPLEGRFFVRCVDITELTVRDVLKEHYASIHNQAKAKDHVIGITILGFGKHGAALLKNAAWIFQFYGYRLQFNVIDLDGKAYQYLQQEAPDLLCDYSKDHDDDSSHDIEFWNRDYGLNCLSSDFDNLFQKDFWERMQKTQLVFVSLGDDNKNIGVSIHMRELFQRKAMEEALEKADLTGTDEEKKKVLKNLEEQFKDPNFACTPLIFAVVNDRYRKDNLEAAANGERGDQARCNYHIKPVGALSNAYDFDKLLELKKLEKSALKNHLAWSFQKVLNSKTDRLDEDILDELVRNTEQYVGYSYYRESSVATSLHQQLLRTVQDEFEELRLEKNIEVPEIRKTTEKMRWNAYMRSLGYQHLDVRNDRVKFHHLIRPYHELPSEEKEKDLIEF